MTMQPLSDASDSCADLGALRAERDRLAAELVALRAYVAALEAAVHEDPLTGLLNRRGFLRELERAIAFRARYGTPVALLVLDLDRFKPINDVHGYAAGDRALVHLAGILRGHVRASDVLGRLGGDIFGLVLWQADAETARRKGDALQALVADAPVGLGRAQLTLGVSVGAVPLEPADTPEGALTRASQATEAQKTARCALQAMMSGVSWSSR